MKIRIFSPQRTQRDTEKIQRRILDRINGIFKIYRIGIKFSLPSSVSLCVLCGLDLEGRLGYGKSRTDDGAV